ncbi:response regulator [Methylobacterium sp. C25]|uniref:response regulator n=1 Tax=Methylobacterium sp. C25 TaxID=2721622 RepID=UPI001F1EE2BB|nr:response regulator [Methylobacterium sp. C25]MCE4222221.1 response regulator [Methylobacterium sp. C25]
MPLDQIGQALASAYDALVSEGIPEHLAALVRQVKHADLDAPPKCGRMALVVEDDPDVRGLAETLLDETELSVVGCDSAEKALNVLREAGGDIALVFADISLAGQMDGIQLANAVATLWPKTRLVITSGVAPERRTEIPDRAVFIPKPWRALDVLVEAGRATRLPPPAVA